MDKPGHALALLADFPPDVAERLRDELSVTTAEELLELATRYPESLARLIGRTDEDLASLLAAVVDEVPDAAPSPADVDRSASDRFATGHEPPPPGHETFDA